MVREKITGKIKIVGENSADRDEENFVKFSLYFLGMQQQPRQSAAAVTTGNEEAWEEGEGVLPHRETTDEQNLQLGLRSATSCGVFFFSQISLGYNDGGEANFGDGVASPVELRT